MVEKRVDEKDSDAPFIGQRRPMRRGGTRWPAHVEEGATARDAAGSGRTSVREGRQVVPRRAFLAMPGAAAVWPGGAWSGPVSVPKIGFRCGACFDNRLAGLAARAADPMRRGVSVME